MPESLVIDASVAVKWFVREPDRDRALDLARRAAERTLRLHACEIWMSKCANVIWKRARQLKRLEPRAAREAVARLGTTAIRDAPTRALLPRAYAIAVDAGVTVYDALYIALAEALDSKVVSADAALLRRLRGTHFAALLEAL